jgi:hypothetical protein
LPLKVYATHNVGLTAFSTSLLQDYRERSSEAMASTTLTTGDNTHRTNAERSNVAAGARTGDAAATAVVTPDMVSLSA